jgi:hypothetical protein
MAKTADRENKLMKLKKDETERFVQELKRINETLKKDEERSKYEEEFSRDLLRAAGINTDRIEAFEKEQAKRTAEEVEKERESLMGGRYNLAETNSKAAVAYEIASQIGSIILPPYTGTLKASNESLLDGMKGEKDGDNSLTPDNPGDINLSAKNSGNGVFAFGGYILYGAEYDLWYTFVPPSTGTYQIRPTLDFHGFYMLKADDKWWNSKHAEVELHLLIDVYQYNWIGKQKYMVVDERKTNGKKNERVDETHSFSHYADLASGDIAVILVRLKMEARAKGNGSYAEINFELGSANYIRPIMLTALHI